MVVRCVPSLHIVLNKIIYYISYYIYVYIVDVIYDDMAVRCVPALAGTRSGRRRWTRHTT